MVSINVRDQFKSDGFGLIKLGNYYKVWSSSVDGCCCSLCSKLEGTAVKLDEPFEVAGRVVQEPPLHDGCRCAVLFVDRSSLEPQLIRVHNAFIKFSNAASTSVDFQSFASCFFAAEYFLSQLAAASVSDLAAVGLSGEKFKAQYRDLQLRRDQLFNAAIKRAYDYELKEAQTLKTNRGKKRRMDSLLQMILATQALSPANYEYLRKLFG